VKATRPNLIIVPVGVSVDHFVKLHNHEFVDFNINDHWRNASNERNYDILAVQYGNFVPEESTYDYLVKATGNKWKIIKTIKSDIDFTQWEYIGAFDDDVVTTTEAINGAFNYAKENNVGAFQLALSPGSESNWPVTRYNPNWSYSETNFMEIMCPCFTQANFQKLLPLLDKYNVNHGWGLDFIFSDYFGCNIGIMHQYLMYHPSRPNTGSTYTKQEAFQEMEELFTQIYPAINPNWKQEQGFVKSYVIRI
jgi:hypothetical protein